MFEFLRHEVDHSVSGQSVSVWEWLKVCAAALLAERRFSQYLQNNSKNLPDLFLFLSGKNVFGA